MCELGEHTWKEEPVRDCDCRRCALAERDRLRNVLRGIAEHHEGQRAAWNDECGDAENAAYHEERRNFVMFTLMVVPNA